MPTRLLLSLILSIASIASITPSAKACGGFFCDNAQPVNQAGERIIFSQNPDGTTTAVIQIQYSGPSERFAWMLPVVGSPEISVSSNIAFQRLQAQTNPQYILNVEVEGECRTPVFLDGGPGADAFLVFDASPAGDAGLEPPVTVVNEGSVGPYDFVVISIDPDAPDVAALATDWLNENDYDVSEFGRDRLVPYLENGMNLLAFRLTKGRNAGEIRPVVLSFGEGLPSIPLRPTAAAATPDMGILVWVVGASRAIPANYLDLELNEARLNWFNPASNYDALVTQAANEAGGQGFVTEFAGDAESIGDGIFSPTQLELWNEVPSMSTDFQKLATTANIFFGWDGLLEAILAELPKPAAASDEEWSRDPLTTLLNYVPGVRDAPTIAGFEFAAFAARMEAEVIDPVRDTAALFESGQTLTRMYTTMSPDEMTMDPVFDFHDELPDYSNIHSATQTIECTSEVLPSEATWRVALNGVTVRGRGRDWPLANSDTLPAVRTTRRLGTSGEGSVIVDNDALIASVVSGNNSAYPRGSTGADGGPGGNDAGSGGNDAGPGGDAGGMVSGGGCATGASSNGNGALALLLAGFVFFRRRR